MASMLRKRQRAKEYTSPEYDYQGFMALSYHRPDPAMMQERAPRTSQPSQRAREAAIGGPQAARPTKRVQFVQQPSPAPAVVAPVTLRPADPLTFPTAVVAPATLRPADPLTTSQSGMAPATLRPADPSSSTPGAKTYPDVLGIPDKYNFRERLPQSFPHGLPPSSLEPGATDQQFPPSSLFPDPPFGDGPELVLEPPLQALTQL